MTPEEEQAQQEKQLAADRYRFGAFKYTLRAPDCHGPNEIIPQETGLYTFPKGDEAVDPSVSFYEHDAPL